MAFKPWSYSRLINKWLEQAAVQRLQHCATGVFQPCSTLTLQFPPAKAAVLWHRAIHSEKSEIVQHAVGHTTGCHWLWTN